MGDWILIDRLGVQFDLTANGVEVLSRAGLGMPRVTHRIQDTAFTPGSLMRGVKVEPRLVTLQQLIHEANYASFLAKRFNLAEIFKSDQVLDDTDPFQLRYVGGIVDLEIDLFYDSGFEMSGRIPSTELVNVRMIAYDPFFRELADDSASLLIGGDRTINNNGSASAYPIFTITGAGTLTLVKNVTTGHEIKFDNLVLAAGEILTIDMGLFKKTFVSDVQGNVIGDVLPGSDLADFKLLPGENRLTVNSGGAATALITWRPLHWSLDAAQRVLGPRTILLQASVTGVATVVGDISGGLSVPLAGSSSGVATVTGTLSA